MPDTPGVQQQLTPDCALPEISFGKSVRKVGRPDQDAKARLEKLVIKVALDEVRALKDTLDPIVYRELFESRTKSLKTYATWREGWQAVIFDPAYAHLFLWSLMQGPHPDITEPEVLAIAEGAPEEVQAALAQVVPDFFTVLLAGLELNPEQSAAVAKALEAFRARLTPTPKTPSN